LSGGRTNPGFAPAEPALSEIECRPDLRSLAELGPYLELPLVPIGALAHLGLAPAYALQGDTAKARAAYQDFIKLWNDADPDIPIFIAAKAEYAKLK